MNSSKCISSNSLKERNALLRFRDVVRIENLSIIDPEI
jgi:hypothetical protein